MKIRYWKAKDGFRWHVIAKNGKLVAESGEAYATRSNAKRAYRRFWGMAPFG